MEIVVTDAVRREAYRVLVEELLITSETPKCPQLADPIVDAAARYILDLPNSWTLMIGGIYTALPTRSQKRLARVVAVLKQLTVEWNDLDESGLSVSKVRIDEAMAYVDEVHRSEDASD